jgi:hypothetical protein
VKYRNISKFKIKHYQPVVMALKEPVKLKKREYWNIYVQMLQVVKKFIYLGEKLESSGEWRRQRYNIKAEGKHTERGTE